MHPPASDFSNSTGASNPVEAEAAQSNGNNRAQYEVSTVMNTLISVAMTENSRNNYSNRDTRTATAGVTDNPSTLVANTSENEKNNKGIMVFVYTTADKVLSFLCALTIFGLVYSHGPNPLLRISDAWIQVIAAGGVISTIGGIILTGAASYFKEIELPDHPGFVLISTMLFFILQYSVLASCIILQGFERSSKRIIWVIGAFVKLSIVAFWFAFQREPMIVGLKWTKDAFEWMLKWTKNAFECMLKWTKNAFECMLSILARDVLTVPVSTVSSESAFSFSGRILEERRTSLTSEMVEIILTVKDWEQTDSRTQHSVENPELSEVFENLYLDNDTDT